MDEATALQVLKQYGAQPTPQNMMRVMQQGGSSDGSAVLGRSMGLQGGVDESGNALDRLAFASAPKSAPPITQAPLPSPEVMPAVQNAQTPTVARVPRQVAGPPEPYGVQEPTGVAVPSTNTNTGTASDSPFLPWLLAALGISSTAGREAMAPRVGGAASATGQALLEGPQNRAMLPAPEEKARISGPGEQKRLTAPNPQLDGPSQSPPSSKSLEAVDKISAGTSNESRRPMNTNADGRNSEPSSKPVNLDTKAPVAGAYDGEPMNLVEEIAKFIKRARK